MINTNSIAFPNMFDIARNKVAVIDDNQSIVNRTRLLMLTEPTELYHEPNFGVGLKQYIFHYNTENQKAIVQDRIKEQLRLHEPYVDPDKTQFADGLLFTGNDTQQPNQEYNRLKMTVALSCIYGDQLEVKLNDE